MAFVAPLALAAGMSAATATWISVGVSVAMMVGSWLYSRSNQQKNEVFDPGAQEMPRFNQALRGATLPVLFGTNRVPSNIVWTKNFTTIRKETDAGGGGGKFGGSGLGGKTPAGGGEVTYEYKWDLIYHIGMVPEPYNIFGGWLGSDRLSDDTILGIQNGGENLNSLLFLNETSRPRNAALNYTDAFYSPGVDTGDPDFVPWAYFTSQNNSVAHWWPSTAYVGFRQLSLGGQPNIPQLTWEIGPGSVDIAVSSQYMADTTIGNADRHMAGAGCVLGDDGKHYVAFSEGVSADSRVHCLETGAQLTISESSIKTLTTGLSWTNGNLPPGAPLTLNFGIMQSGSVKSYVVNGSDYILAHALSATGDAGLVFALLKINSSGALELVGRYFCGASNIDINDVIACGISGMQSDDDPILVAGYRQSGAQNNLFVLPSINTFIATLAQTDSNRFDELNVNCNAVGIFENDFFEVGSYYPDNSSTLPNGFFLPNGASTYFYFYISKAKAQWHIDNPGSGNSVIAANATSNPNGFFLYLDLGAVSFPEDDAVFVVPNGLTLYTDNIEHFPFDDAGLDDNGVASATSDYYEVPSVTRLDDVSLTPVWVILFTKVFATDADKTNGSLVKVRAYIYSALGTFTYYGTQRGSPFKADTDMGSSGPDAFSYNTTDHFTFYWPESQQLVNMQHINGTDVQLDERVVAGQFGTMTISGGGDVLPPYIIKTILTHPAFGLGYTEAMIDDDSYQDVFDYCAVENIRVSTAYYREEGALRIIELLLSLYGGFLVISGGKIKFGRQEVTAPVRTIDNHHLVRDGNTPPVKVTRGAKQDAANKVKVNYIDRALEYRQNFVELADEVDIDINGVRAREFPPQFVMSEATARKLAVRALWAGLYARDQYQFVLGPKDSDLEPGDVITLQDSFHAELSSGVYCRLVKWRESKPGRYEVTGVTEYAEYNSSSLYINSSAQAPTNILFGPAKPPLDFRMYELPKEFQGADAQLYVGWVPGNFAMGARLYASADGVSYASVLDVQPYIIAGRLETNLNSHDGLDQSVHVRLFPSSGFSVNSPTYTMTHQLDDVSQAGRAAGTGMMWVGSEMMAYQGVTLLAQNYYRFDKVFRGWGGTQIHAHSVGDYWWKQGGGVFNQAYNTDKIGTTIYYKVSPYNFAGVEYDIASIDAKSYSILGTYYRPQNNPVIHTFVDTPVIGTSSDDLRGMNYKAVTSGGCKVYLDWSDASRQEGWGQGGYGGSTYGHFASDTTSHQWRVEVLSANGVVVRSVSISTTYYEYDRPVNSADFNGWKGTFTVRVTPWNNYGDALVPAVKDLNLFG
jgi:hypothetical protein